MDRDVTSISQPSDAGAHGGARLADPLRAALGGDVTAPGDAGWDAARQAFNLTIDQRPELVATPRDAEGVARVVRFAAERGLRVAAQRTGHAAAPLGDLTGTVLLRTAALADVQVDAAARRARVGAGALWSDVVGPAADAGLGALHGSSPTICVTGYALGGGIGWYVRKHGLMANSLTAVELVTADGEHVRASADEEPELFWALRGGGGGFGVVTALEMSLFALRDVYAGVLFFPFERAGHVLHAWREWIGGVPEELTSIARLLQFPDRPHLPPHLRGRGFALVEAVHVGDAEQGEALLEPLRALGPVRDTFATIAPPAVTEVHMDPAEPVPFVRGDALLGELSEAGLDRLLAVAGPGSGSPLTSVELRHLGGATARAVAGGGVASHVEGDVLLAAVGMHAGGESRAAVEQRLGQLVDATAPDAASLRCLNFVDQPVGAAACFDAPALERLRQVKRQVDPSGTIRANHDLARE